MSKVSIIHRDDGKKDGVFGKDAKQTGNESAIERAARLSRAIDDVPIGRPREIVGLHTRLDDVERMSENPRKNAGRSAGESDATQAARLTRAKRFEEEKREASVEKAVRKTGGEAAIDSSSESVLRVEFSSAVERGENASFVASTPTTLAFDLESRFDHFHWRVDEGARRSRRYSGEKDAGAERRVRFDESIEDRAVRAVCDRIVDAEDEKRRKKAFV